MGHLDVGYEIRVVSNLLKRNVLKCVVFKEEDEFTDMQGQILGFLFQNMDKDVFQKDLEENFCIRRSTASRFLKTMELRGLVNRESVHYDARLKKLIPTSKAHSIHQAIQEQIRTVEMHITKGISEEELAQFHRTMGKIINNLS